MNFWTWLSDLVKQFLAYFEKLPSAPAAKPEKPPAPKPVPAPTTGTIQVIIAPKNSQEYGLKYAMAKLTPEHASTARQLATKIKFYQAHYKFVEEAVGVPWYIVACIHSLESGMRWDACLHNGERIIGTGRKTTLVPKGKGPFDTWNDAAVDALGGPGAYAKAADWSLGRWLSFLEDYNGRGYSRKKLDSPYVWNFTTEQRTKGKYVADGVWDAQAVSKQCGAAAILKALDVPADVKLINS